MKRLFRHNRPTLLYLSLFTILTTVLGIALWRVNTLQNINPGTSQAGEQGYSLKFYGSQIVDTDRGVIPLVPNKKINVGMDFTLEFWMKALAKDNTALSGACGAWDEGNVMFDRSTNISSIPGSYGVSLIGGHIAFGVQKADVKTTACSTTVVTDGVWHLIALTRNGNTGKMQVFVDGMRVGTADGPTGNIAYSEGVRVPQEFDEDPFLIIGADKKNRPGKGYAGQIDDFTVFNRVEYEGGKYSSTRVPMVPYGPTVALFHFDEPPTNSLHGDPLFDAGPDRLVGELFHTVRGASRLTDHPFMVTATPSPTPKPVLNCTGVADGTLCHPNGNPNNLGSCTAGACRPYSCSGSSCPPIATCPLCNECRVGNKCNDSTNRCETEVKPAGTECRLDTVGTKGVCDGSTVVCRPKVTVSVTPTNASIPSNTPTITPTPRDSQGTVVTTTPTPTELARAPQATVTTSPTNGAQVTATPESPAEPSPTTSAQPSTGSTEESSTPTPTVATTTTKPISVQIANTEEVKREKDIFSLIAGLSFLGMTIFAFIIWMRLRR